MASSELRSAAFWESSRPHVALSGTGSAHADAPAEGLPDFLRHALPGRSVCAFLTSGTESSPKWVLLSKSGLLNSAQAVNDHFEVTKEDRWLVPIPVHHVGGFAIFARAYLSGSTVTETDGKWDPIHFAAQIETQSITLTSLVPTQVHDLVHAGIAAPESLRAIAVGGGGMRPELYDAARRLGWPVFQSYGMTEAASQIATQPLRGSDDPTRLKVLPIWELTTNQDDRLTIRGQALAEGYAHQSESGKWVLSSLDPQKGLLTRDRVRLQEVDGHSFLTFLGRDQDWIKILGELVHLPSLQQRLERLATDLHWSSFPVIAALPETRAGYRLVLVSELAQPDPRPLLQVFNATAVSGIERLAETRLVDCIPRSELGKVRRLELQQLLTETA